MSARIETLAERRDELMERIGLIDSAINGLRSERADTEMERDWLCEDDDDRQDDETDALDGIIDDIDAQIEDLEAERTDCTLALIQIDNESREMLTAWQASVAVTP